MANHTQFAVITATDQELQEMGCKTLKYNQEVVVEKVLFNVKLTLVKINPYTNSFHIMKTNQLNFKNEQLKIQFN